MTAVLDLVAEGSKVTARGEIDVSTCDELRVVLHDVAVQGGAVVVDLREVTFMDSPGISCLINARRVAEEHGGSLTVLASETVDRALTVMALETLLGIAPEG